MLLDQLMQKAMRLHNDGALSEAAALYQQILRVEPRNFGAVYSLGAVCLTGGAFQDAARLFEGATLLAPDHADSWYNRARALARLGQRDEALSAFEQAIALKPDHVEAIVDRAALLLDLKRADDALLACDTALALAPDFPVALVNRGNALFALKRHDEAIESYDKALAIQADFPPALENRAHALFDLGRAERAPAMLMRRLFDSFAANYDQMMLNTLTYTGHESLRTLADAHVAQKRGLSILDLGCGTGLVGEAFKDLAEGGRIDGVDLSPLMIAQARKRGIYGEMFEDDLETVLAASGPDYNLILAADTMIYIGALAPVLTGAAHRLKPGGYFLFTVEAKEGEGWDLPSTHRFRHSLAYIKSEAARAGLEFVASSDIKLRNEETTPVDGFAVALKK
jgi:predicted TPR repeat methyltransferase